MTDDRRVSVVALAGRALLALAIAGFLAAAGGSACTPASVAPALTFGATAIVREHAPAGSEPFALRAGAWVTWRATTAHAGSAHEAPARDETT